MKKNIIAVVIGLPLLISGCTTTTVSTAVVDPVVYNPYGVVYDPQYTTDYVYSVGYYNNKPYWGNQYYYYNTGYPWGNSGYWGGRFYNGY